MVKINNEIELRLLIKSSFISEYLRYAAGLKMKMIEDTKVTTSEAKEQEIDN